MIFPLITFPYLSRILEPEGMGKVNFANSLTSHFVLLASIGIPIYGIREIAKVRDNRVKLSDTAQELFVMHFITSTIVFLVFIALIILNGKLQDEQSLFFVVSISIFLVSLGMDWLYQGQEQYLYITIRSLIFSTISLVSLFFFVHEKGDYVISAGIGVAASSGSAILNFYNAREVILAKRSNPWDFKKHLKPMAIVFVMNFFNSIYLTLDIVLLGFMTLPQNVGYYSAATKLTKITGSIVSSFGQVLLPRLSYYNEHNHTQEFNDILNKSFSITIMLCLPAATGLFMLAPDIINVFAGKNFAPAIDCLVITAPGLLISSLSNILAWQILYPKGKDKAVLIAFIGAAIASVTLNIILIRLFAHVGAAWALLSSESVVFCLLYLLAKKCCNFHTINKSSARYFFATIIMAGIISIKMYIPTSLLRIIIIIPMAGILYFTILILLKDDLICKLIKKIKF
jgi:O-antigen/teichoic acid export membrane protein